MELNINWKIATIVLLALLIITFAVVFGQPELEKRNRNKVLTEIVDAIRTRGKDANGNWQSIRFDYDLVCNIIEN